MSAGPHRAVRHTVSGTGPTHHGFLNILAATTLAADGAHPDEVVDWLECTDARQLVEAVRGRIEQNRPLWYGLGACTIAEPLANLRGLGLLPPAT